MVLQLRELASEMRETLLQCRAPRTPPSHSRSSAARVIVGGAARTADAVLGHGGRRRGGGWSGSAHEEVNAVQPAHGPCTELELSGSERATNRDQDERDEAEIAAGGVRARYEGHGEKEDEAGHGEKEDEAGHGKGMLELDLSSFPLGPGCSSMLALRCREVGFEQDF
eukprot:332025-Rhodomonas_salina.3